MEQYAAMIKALQTPAAMEQLTHLYGNRPGMLVTQVKRYTDLLKKHEEAFNTQREVMLISAPGRTEIGGNHTDHNRGQVLAAAVNLDTVSAVSARDDMIVNLHSAGYPAMTLDLTDLSVRPEENGTTAALIRGVAARMNELGYKIGGFDAVAASTVASGSGLSSSAAFEVMICAILDHLYNGGHAVDYKTRAKLSQYAENVYFGKPSGLLDQMASSAGGLVTVDFKDEDPLVEPMAFDFSEKGYSLVVVGTGGSHADLTDDYAAIPAEMKAIAMQFGAKDLRDVRPEDFHKSLPMLHERCSDRAILRAMHFFAENERVRTQVDALRRNDLDAFFRAILSSGRSSFMYLQNVYATPAEQGLSLALALAEEMLDGCGAWRVHGGGFAGTTLNFVPDEKLEKFIAVMNSVFGSNSCHVLSIRPEGAARLTL